MMTNLLLYIEPISITLVIVCIVVCILYYAIVLFTKVKNLIRIIKQNNCSLELLQQKLDCYSKVFNTVEPQIADIEYRLGFLAGKIVMLEGTSNVTNT